MTEALPCKPLYFRLGSQLLEPGSKYSGLMGTKSAFNADAAAGFAELNSQVRRKCSMAVWSTEV